jgi:hypothetical protein
MRVVGAILGLLLVGIAACGNGGNETSAQGNDIYPNSEVLREVKSSTAELYDPPAGDNSCPTSFTDYGTNDSPEDVTKFFEARGFQRRGEGGPFDGGYRWIGVREGDESAWRKVDIANGATAGRSEWTTFYAVFEPACGTSG